MSAPRILSLAEQTANEFERDYNLCKQAEYEYRTNPKATDGIRFECFNTTDVENLKDIMQKYFPLVPVTYSAMFNN